jgi:hypothetical protein
MSGADDVTLVQPVRRCVDVFGLVQANPSARVVDYGVRPARATMYVRDNLRRL